MTGPAVPGIPPRRRQTFRRRLIRWYAWHGRDLPWRRTRDPYHILVSEIMLQQTQVERVVPKYHEWLERYPSLESLAAASAREVREAWYPLGYNVRPRRLRDIARAAVRRHAGRVPDTRESLLALKGIGRYTAGAVLSFAYGQDEAILDTNVRRVLRRVFIGEAAPAADRVLWALAAELLPSGEAYDFNQALMDLGATLCTPRRPRCAACPVRRICLSYPKAAGTPAPAPRPRRGRPGQRPTA